VPELSLLVPLEDARGDAVEHLRTWTHEQSLPRERYQVVITSTGEDPEGEEPVRELLAEHDVFAHVPGANLLELWNAAAERADSDWLVLTENHCEGDPACLASVARAVAANGGHDALTLDHGHITTSATGDLNARWFDQIYEEWDQPGQWPRLNLVGFAIQRGVYQEAGGLDPRYGLFSTPLLSARLHRRGARVGHVSDAHVLHVHPDEIEEHHGHSADFARGECEARTREDRAFCESYFGPAPIWTNRLRFEPHVARRAGAVIAASAARALLGRRNELPWLLRELAAWLPAAAGPGPYLARARLLFRLCEQAASRGFVPPELSWRAFLRAQALVLELTQLAWVRDELEPPSTPRPWSGRRGVEELGHEELVGVHGLERRGEQWFRWSEPVSVLRLAATGEGRSLRVETAGLRGTPLEGLRAAYVDGRRVAPDLLRSEGTAVVLPLPGRPGNGGGVTTVTLLTRPLEPQPSGPRDPRRLGMPIVSIAV
jgi:hypothetical protein